MSRRADCPVYESLSAFHDGDLAAADSESVGAHLAGCPDCRAEVEALDGLVGHARALDRPEPPAALWPAIASELDRRTSVSTRFRPYLVGAFAGAAMVVVVGGAALRWRAGASSAAGPIASRAASREAAGQARPADPLVAEAEAELERAAGQWEASIRKLHAVVEASQAGWSADTRARHAERLARLDREIGRSREALRRAPADAVGGDVLFAAYRQKVTYLAEVVHRGVPPGGGSSP